VHRGKRHVKIRNPIENTGRRGRRRRQLLDDLPGKRRWLKLEGWSTRLHSVENWLLNGLWTCRKTDRLRNEWLNNSPTRYWSVKLLFLEGLGLISNHPSHRWFFSRTSLPLCPLVVFTFHASEKWLCVLKIINSGTAAHRYIMAPRLFTCLNPWRNSVKRFAKSLTRPAVIRLLPYRTTVK
jgi:hypothetical protein